MKEDVKFYTSQNREAWNEVVPKHQAMSKEKLDQLFSKPGYIDITDEVFLHVLKEYSVVGKDIIHLCCNNGWELLSIKNMGAKHCVGIDISDLAIIEAQDRAKKCKIDCEFICSDVYEISEQLHNSFDVVALTAGCVGWIPDLNGFIKIAFNLLRKDGVIIIREIHPFSEMLPFDNNNIENRLQIIEPYFRDKPIIENSSLDYIGGTDYVGQTQYWFVHTISSLVMALVASGFKIEHFSEHSNDISAGHKKQEELDIKIPLSYTLIGRKE
jgi:SAM-dependent methyltransferase